MRGSRIDACILHQSVLSCSQKSEAPWLNLTFEQHKLHPCINFSVSRHGCKCVFMEEKTSPTTKHLSLLQDHHLFFIQPFFQRVYLTCRIISAEQSRIGQMAYFLNVSKFGLNKAFLSASGSGSGEECCRCPGEGACREAWTSPLLVVELCSRL